MKNLFYKAKDEGKDFYKCLMIYHNTPLTGIMKSHMQILQGRNARSDLPMSNAARKQLGIQPQVVRNNDKHAVLPTHNLHVGQDVMYQDSASKHWYPAVIQSLCSEPRSYKILTRDGIVYRKSQSHLKPFTPQNKNSQSSKGASPSMAQSTHMWPVKQTECKKSSTVNNHVQVQASRLKRDFKPQSSLLFKYFSFLNAYWIYIYIYIYIVFTCICKCPCNGIQAVESYICTCMNFHITLQCLPN